jgi:hypothetical protein
MPTVLITFINNLNQTKDAFVLLVGAHGKVLLPNFRHKIRTPVFGFLNRVRVGIRLTEPNMDKKNILVIGNMSKNTPRKVPYRTEAFLKGRESGLCVKKSGSGSTTLVKMM